MKLLVINLVRYSYLGWLFGLCACADSNDEPCVILNSDFEQFEGWINPLPPFVTTEQAYSGRYSYRLADGELYGGSYTTSLAACSFVPRKLKVSARVYLASGRIRATALVVNVLCHGRRPDVWAALPIDQVVKRYRVWEPVHKYIHLPADLDASDEIKVYVWHIEPGGETTWFDDIKIEGWQ